MTAECASSRRPTRHSALFLCLAALRCLPASAGEAGSPDEHETSARPNYSFQRSEENWSQLRGMPRDTAEDWFDPIKYLPLDDRGDVWLCLGGHVRGRVESWHDFGFGAASDDDDLFLLYRMTVHADLHVKDWLRIFVEGKSAYSTNRDLPGGNRQADRDSIALEQAFVDLKQAVGSGEGVLRLGRQALSFGKQRLVSPLPWANTLRRWDGTRAIYESQTWRVSGFFTWFAPTQKYDFNETETDLPFWGLYGTRQFGSSGGIDLYYLGFGNHMAPTWNGTGGSETRHTLGSRIWAGGGSPWDFDAEFAYQVGEVGSADVNAYMVGSEAGYTLRSTAWTPRLFAGIDVGSGDRRAGGGVQTFNQLYPLAHAFLGMADVIGRQNVISPSLGILVVPSPRTKIGMRSYWFWRASTRDAVYGAAGTPIRSGSAGTASEVGSEVDAWVEHRFDRHLSVLIGYSHFFAGNFIEQSGADQDIDFFFAHAQYTF